MILYVSVAGSGTSDTLERALIAAVEADTDLRYLAVIDDEHFGDVDGATMVMVAEELDFILRAQLIAVRRRVPASPEGHVVIHRGDVVDAVAAGVADEILIGGPLALTPTAVSELVASLEQRSGVGVTVLTD